MKSLKKISLKKETVAELDNYSQSRVKGGNTWDYLVEYIEGMQSHLNPAGCMASQPGHGHCPNSYVGPQCPGPGYQEPKPNTDINQCPNHSAEGSGCDAETCGWAYTCNGR